MAIYLGDKKIKINLDNIQYHLNLCSTTPILNGVRLLALNGIILKDKNDLYLSVKEDK